MCGAVSANRCDSAELSMVTTVKPSLQNVRHQAVMSRRAAPGRAVLGKLRAQQDLAETLSNTVASLPIIGQAFRSGSSEEKTGAGPKTIPGANLAVAVAVVFSVGVAVSTSMAVYFRSFLLSLFLSLVLSLLLSV